MKQLDKDFDIIEDYKIIKCYEHFKKRYDERYKGNELSYKGYWNSWIKNFVGVFVYKEDDKMIRMIGNYHKDTQIYKCVYIYIHKYNIYVPLTIYKLETHKQKFRLNQIILRNK